MNIYQALKCVFAGRRLANAQLGETLPPKRLALPVFALDALSSVAYAPDEILIILSLVGVTGYLFSWQIGLAVEVVIVVVTMSYRQTVRAYPAGGGDYEVAALNLGRHAGLAAASALLVDYVLTVAVSISASVLNVRAMLPGIGGYKVPIAVGVIVAPALMNPRGVRDPGGVLAWPTYVLMFPTLLMFVTGFFRILVLGHSPKSETSDLTVIGAQSADQASGQVLIAIITRAFLSGCAVLTGVEIVANGVPSSRPPKSRNAVSVLGLLGLIAVTMPAGIVLLASPTRVHLIDGLTGTHYLKPDGSTIRTVAMTTTEQLTRMAFGDWFAPGFYVAITATLSIPLLATNTASNGLPSLASILVKDGYLPRQLHTHGDRLIYSNGIVLLAVTVIVLVWGSNASVTALIQLYVVEVFISLAVRQTGMVLHWNRAPRVEKDRDKRRRMQRSRVVNPLGVGVTAVVLVVVFTSKFTYGAYLALIVIGLMYLLMILIRRHYDQVRDELALRPESDRVLLSRVRAVVLVQQVNLPTAKAIAYTKAGRATSLVGATISVDNEGARELMETWRREDSGIPLRVIASLYREITQPFTRYVTEMRTENPRDVVAVYTPDYAVGNRWERLLHNQTTLLTRTRLHYMSGVTMISVSYQLSSSRRREARQGTR